MDMVSKVIKYFLARGESISAKMTDEIKLKYFAKTRAKKKKFLYDAVQIRI